MMGMFDTVEIKCPYCEKLSSSQTKVLGDCCLETFGIGSEVDSDIYSGIFELKNKCECGQPLRILILGGRIISSTKDKSKYIEKEWGEVVEVGK